MNSIKQSAFIGIIISSIFFGSVVLAEAGQNMTMILNSPDFVHQGEIPKSFTCDGDDISPALSWSGIPKNAQSLVLIVDDPDAPDPAKPKMTWVHWLLYNIPSVTTELPKAIVVEALPAKTQQGKNDWNLTGYRGPCPPIGKHRYFFKLYALDIQLPDLHLPNKSQLEKAMKGHVMEKAELIGTYQRQ